MSLLTLAAGRRSKFVVAGLTLLITLALSSQAGKLTGVTSNNQADSLPRGAESVAALTAVKRFPAGATTPAVTVIRRDGGLTAADRAYLDGRRTSLNSDRLAYARFTPPAIVSRDGTTAVLVTPFATADDVKVSDSTKALRARLAVGRPSGLTVHVTGAAGVLTDVSRYSCSEPRPITRCCSLRATARSCAATRTPMSRWRSRCAQSDPRSWPAA